MRSHKRNDQERKFYAALRPALIEAAFAKGCTKRTPGLAWVMHDFAKFVDELNDPRAQSAARDWARRNGLSLDCVAFVHATKQILREQVWPSAYTKNNKGINAAIDDLVRSRIVIVVHNTKAARNGLSDAALYALVLPTNQNHTHSSGSDDAADQNHTHSSGSDGPQNQKHTCQEPVTTFGATETTSMDVVPTQIPNTELNKEDEEVKSIGQLVPEAIAHAAAVSGQQVPTKPTAAADRPTNIDSSAALPQPQEFDGPRKWSDAYAAIRRRQ